MAARRFLKGGGERFFKGGPTPLRGPKSGQGALGALNKKGPFLKRKIGKG